MTTDINLQKSILLCHPAARAAFLAWDSIPVSRPCLAIDQNTIPKHTLALLQSRPVSLTRQDSAHGVSTKQKNKGFFHFINGFSVIRMLLNESTRLANFTVYTGVDHSAVAEHAWFEVIQLMYAPLDPQVGWISFRHVVNHQMPRDLVKKYFGHPQLTLRQLSQISGMSVKTLERQRKNFYSGGWQ